MSPMEIEQQRAPMQIRIDTEGNPETKWIDVTGTDSDFMVETSGRPKPGGIKIDPNNYVLKSTPNLRARAAIARGEELAEAGKYYDAILRSQKALSIQPNRSLANFRMGEAFFYQKNYQASANAFREALATVPEPSEKWTEVWSHIYLGKIFDLLGQRERALNEYSKARATNDNTGGAQDVVEALVKKPYTEAGMPPITPSNKGRLASSRKSLPRMCPRQRQAISQRSRSPRRKSSRVGNGATSESFAACFVFGCRSSTWRLEKRRWR